MPIYEYQCQQCQHKLEVMQRISDALLTTCPSCGKDALKKLVSAVGFQLKGTGWYETDFKNKPKPKPDASADGDKKGDGEKKSDGDGAKSAPDAKAGESKSASDSKPGSSSTSAGD